MSNTYRDLIAWQKAMDLAQEVYAITSAFPAEERYGLMSQMRRCAVSIASNIAEGHGRLTTRDWQHFLSQARGSTHELETQLMISRRLKFGDISRVDHCLQNAEEVGRIINGLLNSTRTRPDRKSFA
ncbi:MAG TPA: four helix bundle protein [Thermoanaerobaculia bacterium]|jgi:four helix bundle protein|nr:four helix bundle protein [Thermoanaerobaculia bacterium]